MWILGVCIFFILSKLSAFSVPFLSGDVNCTCLFPSHGVWVAVLRIDLLVTSGLIVKTFTSSPNVVNGVSSNVS